MAFFRRKSKEELSGGDGINPIRRAARAKEIDPAATQPRENTRLDAWDLQRKLQLGRKWNQRLTERTFEDAINEINVKLASSGYHLSLAIKESRGRLYLQLAKTERAGGVEDSRLIPARTFKPDDAMSLIMRFLADNRVKY